MIKWVAPQYLYGLILVPIIIILFILHNTYKRKIMRRVAEESLIPRLTDRVNWTIKNIKFFLIVLGIGFLCIAMARPKWGERLQIYKGKGIDIVIALDASKSMLAQDIKPNRLERAKTEVASLLSNLSTNEVGITAFAGDCYVMCPLTSDVEAARLFLDIISPDMIPKPGTNIRRAIEVSSSLFNPKETTHKALILITDGENLQDNPLAQLQSAKEQGIRIFTVGMGTPEGSPIPKLDDAGNIVSYKKDKEGKLVMSHLAENFLIAIAKATDGRYFRATGGSLNQLFNELDKMEKKEMGESEFIGYEERYQYFLIFSFLLIFIGLFLSDRRGRWFQPFFIFISLMLLAKPVYADVGGLMRQGNKLYNKQDYNGALNHYQQALVLEPDNLKIHYNIGRTLHKLNKNEEAIGQFGLSLLSKDRNFRAKTLYNIGNCQFRAGNLNAAIDAYTNALLLDPDDRETKENLEFCLKLEEQLKQKAKNDSLKQNEKEKKEQLKPKPQPQEITQREADRFLQALQSKEKENLRKSKMKKRKKEDVEKDW